MRRLLFAVFLPQDRINTLPYLLRFLYLVFQCEIAAGQLLPLGGQCGWCHSRLVSGEVFIPDEADGRREADKKFGWIHPCCTYPLSDIELDVPAVM